MSCITTHNHPLDAKNLYHPRSNQTHPHTRAQQPEPISGKSSQARIPQSSVDRRPSAHADTTTGRADFSPTARSDGAVSALAAHTPCCIHAPRPAGAARAHQSRGRRRRPGSTAGELAHTHTHTAGSTAIERPPPFAPPPVLVSLSHVCAHGCISRLCAVFRGDRSLRRACDDRLCARLLWIAG